MQRYLDIDTAFHAHGLALRGGLHASPECALPGAATRTLLLVGNPGRDMWPHFAQARENEPELALDEWTRRVVEPVAEQFDAQAVYVFDGPPFHPFQRWARAAEGLDFAPNNMLIHPEYGIWQAYRAALLLTEEIDLPGTPDSGHPCDDCNDKPCVTACPAQALGNDGFGFERCVGNFAVDPATACMDGCLSRLACPVGREHAYPLEQRQFHMRQFVQRHVPDWSPK